MDFLLLQREVTHQVRQQEDHHLHRKGHHHRQKDLRQLVEKFTDKIKEEEQIMRITLHI